jgi:hypothetical protein
VSFQVPRPDRLGSNSQLGRTYWSGALFCFVADARIVSISDCWELRAGPQRPADSDGRIGRPFRGWIAIVQKRRRTIGQLMEKCEVVNGAPGGKPVSRPSCTRVRIVNSSLSCPR